MALGTQTRTVGGPFSLLTVSLTRTHENEISMCDNLWKSKVSPKFKEKRRSNDLRAVFLFQLFAYISFRLFFSIFF